MSEQPDRNHAEGRALKFLAGGLLLMAILSLSAVVGAQSPPLGLIIASLALLAAILAADGRRRSVRRRGRSRSRSLAEYVADEAMRRVQFVPAGNMPAVRDIGVLAYRDSAEPLIYRRHAVPGNITHLRPYLVCRWPWLRGQTKNVRFALRDGYGDVQFTAEQAARLLSGMNLVAPGTWLSLDGLHERTGRWRLDVWIDDQRVALHPFRVKSVYKSELSGLIDADGEIALENLDTPEEPLSLQALLRGPSGLRPKE
jgi:hypothetical protein